MRISIGLTSKGNYSYDLRCHHKIQGFVYNLLKDTKYVKLHDKNGPKFFCFSNIIPPKDIFQEDKRTLVIASPVKEIIIEMQKRLLDMFNKDIGIGEYSFTIKSVKVFSNNIQKNASIITGTPIIIRIPKVKFKEYGIEHSGKYIYWSSKKGDPFEPFIKQLEENLLKKYKSFYNLTTKQIKNMESETLPLFQEFYFKKSVCNHVLIEGQEHKVYGSLWRFNFYHLNKKQQELLQFGLDTGFGEKNSMGFGFANLAR